MSSFLFVMWAGGGCVNPFMAMAEQALARGHDVSAVATASLEGRLTAAGIRVAGTAKGWLPNAEDARSAVAACSPDVLVVDYMLTSALCGAEACGLPTAVIVHTLYTALLVDGAPSPMGMARSLADLNQVRLGIGLGPIASYAELLSAAALVAVAAPAELDVHAELPFNVVYVGPLFEGPGPDAGWLPPVGQGPLVVVSTGTAGDPDLEAPLLERIFEALASLPVRGLVTVADYVDLSRQRPPANVTVTGYVRHSAVLPHAGLMITHGGLGSVCAALAHGVPMVCLPLQREQPENARAVVRIGAGTALDPVTSASELRVAIDEELRRGGRVRIDAEPSKAFRLLERLVAERA